MRCPRPPRNRPAPPKSGTVFLRPENERRLVLRDLDRNDADAARKRGGVEAILARSRAPVPPRPTLSTLNLVPEMPSLASGSTQIEPALSAGNAPSSARARQPNIRSGSICPITCRAVTGAGRSGCTQVCSSATHLERLERAGVVRNRRRDDALQPEHRIRVGVALRRVDAARRRCELPA
jgi:hypothetical protein